MARAYVQLEAGLRMVGLVAQVARVLEPIAAMVAGHVHRQLAAEGEATWAHAAPNNYISSISIFHIIIYSTRVGAHSSIREQNINEKLRKKNLTSYFINFCFIRLSGARGTHYEKCKFR